MHEIELIINSDGLVLVPRGNKEENSIAANVFPEHDLTNFVEISESFENIYGNRQLCG